MINVSTSGYSCNRTFLMQLVGAKIRIGYKRVFLKLVSYPGSAVQKLSTVLSVKWALTLRKVQMYKLSGASLTSRPTIKRRPTNKQTSELKHCP